MCPRDYIMYIVWSVQTWALGAIAGAPWNTVSFSSWDFFVSSIMCLFPTSRNKYRCHGAAIELWRWCAVNRTLEGDAPDRRLCTSLLKSNGRKRLRWCDEDPVVSWGWLRERSSVFLGKLFPLGVLCVCGHLRPRTGAGAGGVCDLHHWWDILYDAFTDTHCKTIDNSSILCFYYLW